MALQTLPRMALVFILAAMLLPACSKEQAPKKGLKDVIARPAVDITLPELHIPPPSFSGQRGLKAAQRPPIGRFLLPETAEAAKVVDSGNIYEVEVGLDDVLEFYKRQGCRVVRNPVGATVYPREGDGILQVVPGKGRKLELMFIPATRLPEPAEPPRVKREHYSPETHDKVKQKLTSGDGNVGHLLPEDLQD